jgi:RND superfamily putative drug exporter
MLERIASLTWHRPKLVLSGLGAFVALAIGFGYNVQHHLVAAGFTDSSTQSERATTLLRRTLGYNPSPGLALLLRPRGGGDLNIGDPTVAREIDRIATQLGKARFVGNVLNPLMDPAAGALFARDGKSVIVAGELTTGDIERDGGTAADDARRLTRSRILSVAIGGFGPGFSQVNDQTRADLTKAELIAFPVLGVLLVVIFRGLVAASIPLLIGGASIVGTFLMLRVMSLFVATSLFGLNIASGLSLGLAVDYALLMVTRYREEIATLGPTREAHRRTVLTAGRTALFSGVTVALIAFPQRFLYSVGAAGAAVGILASVIALLAVPSLLALLGPRINALSVRPRRSDFGDSDRWYRLARGVMRHPVLVALGCGALLLAAASPLRTAVLTGPSAQAIPPGKPSYIANQAIDAAYGRGVTEAVTVTVHGTATPAQLAAFDAAVARTPGIRGGTPFVRASPSVAFATFTPISPALSHASQRAVRTIRRLAPPGASQVLVSGNTAGFIDEKQSLLDHLPLVAAIIAAVTLLLLFALTGSVILPIKTLLMNVITLAATLGIVVLAFQHGVLTGLLGYSGPSAVEINSLVFLFAVIFGLATDYAVLVMARIKEQHDLGLPNEEAVAIGIARTGRVITAAALMIAVVFMAFAVSKVFFMKEIAVGQTFGVLVDATIVRALLVPALMRLFGEWNWWAPKPLRRVHRRLGIQEG